MLDLTKAPECGIVYAVFDDHVCYEKYNGKHELEKYNRKHELEEQSAGSGTLLELHAFDSVSEYRYVKTAGRGCMEMVIADSTMAAELGWENDEMDQHLYEEDVFVTREADRQDNLKNKVGIVNYIQYDEDDMLHIVNYRLKEV